ncbi:MAG: PDZ domain-containing protein [Bacilli bacterium]|nr:PDZ domain-containing protein [Bacilli bacterium]
MVEEKQIKIEKISDRLKNFFKNPKEVISFFLPIIIAIILVIPLPYYVKLGGGIIKLENKIDIDEKGENGHFGALYVRESKAVVLTYILSYIVPSYDREKQEEVIINDENTENYDYREKLYFTSSIDAATKTAFEKAGKSIEVASSKFLIIYIDKDSKTNLKVGDEIIKVNGKSTKTYSEITEEIKKSKDNVKITVIRDKKEIETNNSFMNIDGESKLGIVISNEIKYTSDPKVKLKFNGKEAGPSGGLMIALTIYDKLVKEDITKGRLVVGTGTIDIDGNIGEIGGVKHKLMAAAKKKADVVFIPYDNYKEAKSLYDKNNYKFALVPVKTFDEAVNYLEEK